MFILFQCKNTSNYSIGINLRLVYKLNLKKTKDSLIPSIKNKISAIKRVSLNCILDFNILDNGRIKIDFFIDDLKKSTFIENLNVSNPEPKDKIDFSVFSTELGTADSYLIGIPPQYEINF